MDRTYLGPMGGWEITMKVGDWRSDDNILRSAVGRTANPFCCTSQGAANALLSNSSDSALSISLGFENEGMDRDTP